MKIIQTYASTLLQKYLHDKFGYVIKDMTLAKKGTTSLKNMALTKKAYNVPEGHDIDEKSAARPLRT